MVKKLLLILTGYCILIFVSACIRCNCEPVKNFNATVSEINAGMFIYSFQGDTMFRLAPIEADSMRYDSYGINLNFIGTIVKAEQPLSFSLINTAYACKCEIDDSYFFLDSISSINITTINDFDEQHLSGKDVTAYFVYIDNADYKVRKNPIEYLYTINQPSYYPGYYFPLYLNARPTLNPNIQFDIKVTFKNGKEQQTRTKSTYLY